VEKGLLSYSDLILAGDLNFSLGTDEIWGSNAVIDPLASLQILLWWMWPHHNWCRRGVMAGWGNPTFLSVWTDSSCHMVYLEQCRDIDHGSVRVTFQIMPLFFFNWILGFQRLCTLSNLTRFG
jgi:hypothetical protein